MSTKIKSPKLLLETASRVV